MRPVPAASVTATASDENTKAASSSTIVPVAVPLSSVGPSTHPSTPRARGLRKFIVRVSLASTSWSPLTFTVTALEVVPFGKTGLPETPL